MSGVLTQQQYENGVHAEKHPISIFCCWNRMFGYFVREMALLIKKTPHYSSP